MKSLRILGEIEYARHLNLEIGSRPLHFIRSGLRRIVCGKKPKFFCEYPKRASRISYSGIDFGIGLRMVFGTKVLYGFTNNSNEDELKRIANELAAKDRRDPVITAQNFDYRKFKDFHPTSIPLSKDYSISTKVDFLMKANEAAKKAGTKITQTRGYARQREQQVEIFNSEGLHIQDTRNYIRVGHELHRFGWKRTSNGLMERWWALRLGIKSKN